MPTNLPPSRPTIVHAHRPKPFSAELELELTAYELVATRGRSTQRFPLTAIERVSLCFSPRNTAHRAFACTVRATDGKSVTFDSLSWKSLIETEKQNDAYARFVSELCERAAAARPEVELFAGIVPFKYWGMLGIGVPVMLALVAVAIYSVFLNSTFSAVFSLVLLGYLGFWLSDYLKRNRPERFAPGAIPPRVLP
jgi:hypothetical protein